MELIYYLLDYHETKYMCAIQKRLFITQNMSTVKTGRQGQGGDDREVGCMEQKPEKVALLTVSGTVFCLSALSLHGLWLPNSPRKAPHIKCHQPAPASRLLHCHQQGRIGISENSCQFALPELSR